MDARWPHKNIKETIASIVRYRYFPEWTVSESATMKSEWQSHASIFLRLGAAYTNCVDNATYLYSGHEYTSHCNKTEIGRTLEGYAVDDGWDEDEMVVFAAGRRHSSVATPSSKAGRAPPGPPRPFSSSQTSSNGHSVQKPKSDCCPRSCFHFLGRTSSRPTR